MSVWVERSADLYMSPPSPKTKAPANKMGMSNDNSLQKSSAFSLQKSKHVRNFSTSNEHLDMVGKVMEKDMNDNEKPQHNQIPEEQNAMKLFTSSMKNIRKSHTALNDSMEYNPEPSLCSSMTSLHTDVIDDPVTPPFNSYYSVGNGNSRYPYYDPLDIGGPKRVVISNSPHSSNGSKTSGSPQKSPVRSILKKRNVPSNSVSSSEGVEPYRLSKSEGDLTRSPISTIPSRPPSILSDITFSRLPPSTDTSPKHKSAFMSVKPRHNIIPKADGPIVAIHPTNGLLMPVEQSVQMQVTPRTIGSLPLQLNPVVAYTSINQQLMSEQKMAPPQNSQNTNNQIHVKRQNSKRQDNPSKTKSKTDMSKKKNKLRKNSNSSSILSSESPLPSAEVISNEATRIRALIEELSKEELQETILKKLDSKDPDSINALSKIFPASKFISKAHCVRCHKDYNPKEKGRCMLSHPERMVAKIGCDDMGADFVCGCCNVAFRLIKMDFYEESTNALLTGHCYSGLHTSDPESVDYRLSGGAAKTCQENGCVEFYV